MIKIYSVLMGYDEDPYKHNAYNLVLNSYSTQKAAEDYAQKVSRTTGPAIKIYVYELTVQNQENQRHFGQWLKVYQHGILINQLRDQHKVNPNARGVEFEHNFS